MRKPFTYYPIVALVILLSTLFAPLAAAFAAPPKQTVPPEEQAKSLLEHLTPEERVGQLFIVTFNGVDVSRESQIHQLITNYHLGGVLLRASNNNFVGPDNTLESTQNMISDIQRAKWIASFQAQTEPSTQESFTPAFIPLFISLSQEGDGYPYDQIYNGLTTLPTPMSIGATWEPSLANRAGFVIGQELSALGVNLLLGPSLDVLETPNPERLGDLGVRTFGGDPFWVGQMGNALINGAHQGSSGKLALVGKHFPGHGGSDRPPEEEVATVRKTLEQLKLIELAPFFAVTGEASNSTATVDALLISHIRYQGFQDNIRANTRPVSLDEQAFAQLMSLPQFTSWREQGGVVISDNLGSRAVRRFYDPGDTGVFNARLVARDALLAGNDLLLIGNFIGSGDPDSFTTITSTLEFFAQKYREDLAFAQRVDESVQRVLTLKYKIYNNFDLQNVLPNPENLENIGNMQEITFEVARQSASLISPSLSELDTRLPEAPDISERIVFISDTLTFHQCETCPEQEAFAEDAFQQAVIRLYGPEAGGQIVPRNLSSYNFQDLLNMLEETNGSTLEAILGGADWIVVNMLSEQENRPSSFAFRRLLSERPDLIRQKRLIVFAFNAPYYLDSTDISKLTAYYGLYSKSPQFVEIAARILLKEITALTGAPSVSIEGIGYDLISATAPSPNQIIAVLLDVEEPETEEQPTETITPQPTPTPEFMVGDLLPIRTGTILDHNGNPVPDGTPVQFIFNLAGQESRPPPTITSNGIARTTFLITGPGPLEISAISEPAIQSLPLQLDIPTPDEPFSLETPSPSPTTTPTQAPTSTRTEIPQATPTPPPPETNGAPNLSDWALSLLASLLVGLSAYRLGIALGDLRWSVRWSLSAFIGGWLTYIFLALELTTLPSLIDEASDLDVFWIVLTGAVFGWLIALLWRWLENGRSGKKIAPSQR